MDLLSNRKPREGFKVDFELKELVHNARMGEVIPDDISKLTDSMFDQTYKTLGQKSGKYDFIMRGGSALKSVSNLFGHLKKYRIVGMKLR